jgi:RNA polymerase sigma-70 factor (ECF subfamily)
MCARIRAGDEAAFVELYEAWFDRLMAFAMKSTGRDEAFAADIAQETFVRVIRSLPVLDSRAALEAWILTTARRIAIDALRSELARARRERSSPPGAQASGADPDALAALRASLDELEAREREAVVVGIGQGLTLAEVALSLGVTSGAASGRVRRSLQKLRTVIARMMP